MACNCALAAPHAAHEAAPPAQEPESSACAPSTSPADIAGRQVPGHWEGDRATRSCTNLSGLTDWRGG